MKKFVLWVSLFALVITLSAPTYATSGTSVYTDNESGVTFVISDNWKQEAFSKDREFIDAKFVSTRDDGCTIIYGSTDVWGQMSVADRAGYTRSELNNSIFTKADIAEMYNTTADQISTVTYNGVQYFQGEIQSYADFHGVDIPVMMTQLVRIDNGWMYMFQFGGLSPKGCYSEFESVMKSVWYPDSPGSNNSNRLNDYTKNADVIIGIVLLVAVIIVVIVLFRRKMSVRTMNRMLSASQFPINSDSTITCNNCGQALPSDSLFCHMCGTKIEKED